MLLFVPRKRISIGMITGIPASVENKYVPGSGVGASSISARRAKSIHATPKKESYTLPGVPTNLSVTAIDGIATVSFSQVNDGGCNISNYLYSIDNGVSFLEFNPIQNSSPVLISGLLQDGTSYSIQLKAKNCLGVGQSSNTIIVNSYGKPSAPTNLSATYGNRTATITFSTPISNGGTAITNYEYSTDGGTSFTAFSPAVTSSPVTISNLTNGNTYSVKLRAVTNVATGAVSTSVSVTPATTPNAPSSLSSSSGNRTATISFTPPSDNGGSAITNYQYSTDGGTSFTAFSPAVTSSPVTISSLNNGTTYTILLKAVNNVGVGAVSTSVSVTPATTPDAPTNLSKTVSNQQATITFTEPATGGSAITNYQYSTDGGTTYTSFSPAVTSSPVTITGLTNNTTYSIKLKAVNSVGSGTASSSISVKPNNFTPLAGSLQFNGSNKLNLSPGVAVGAGAYTVECWFYNSGSWSINAPYPALLGFSLNNESQALAVFFTGNNGIMTDKNGGGWRPTYSVPTPITLNEWHHFVLVRDSNLIETIFIDGEKANNAGGLGGTPTGGQQVNSGNYSGHSDEIGHFYQGNWNGYFTNFRIVAGTAIYDPTASSITVPIAPLTAVTNTKYLMLGDSITSDAASIQTVTNSNSVTRTTTQKPF